MPLPKDLEREFFPPDRQQTTYGIDIELRARGDAWPAHQRDIEFRIFVEELPERPHDAQVDYLAKLAERELQSLTNERVHIVDRRADIICMRLPLDGKPW